MHTLYRRGFRTPPEDSWGTNISQYSSFLCVVWLFEYYIAFCIVLWFCESVFLPRLLNLMLLYYIILYCVTFNLNLWICSVGKFHPILSRAQTWTATNVILRLNSGKFKLRTRPLNICRYINSDKIIIHVKIL